ncbi:cation diffusion facilitator family transporter [Marinococcus halophilus]|uniref:cation diffusion facilitator family transporter n=1 Tax=Marinococcus halophilus TaxID=1371 RepID=UPI0009A8CC84|nr:cation transporter [Marinococcus halophilus]
MNVKQEKKILWISIMATVLFSGTGMVLGLWFQSQMIVFDGLYSLVGVALSCVSLAAATWMATTDWKRYPFGLDIVEPLVVLFKYMVILLLIAGSAAAALVSLFQGGRDMQVGPAFVYSFIGLLACGAVARYLHVHASRSQSALLKAESNQWLMDTLVSMGVFVGFLVAFMLEIFQWFPSFIPYVDPVMVLLVSVYFLRFPLKEMRLALREVLAMSSHEGIRRRMEETLEELAGDYNVEESFLRMTKVGRTLWVEIDIVALESSPLNSLKKQDEMREKLAAVLTGAAPKKWLTVSFMADRHWALDD